MASNIPPKLRETAKQSYYTKGEVEGEIKPARFKAHIAEPGQGANIMKRNPCHYEDYEVKPRSTFVRTGGYTPGLYAGRSEVDPKESSVKSGLSSLSEAKLAKKREFAE